MGYVTGGIAFGYKTLILSDIPVSFTTAEALIAQILFFIASGVLLIALLSFQTRIGLGITIWVLTFTLLFNSQVIRSEMWEAGTNSSAEQLQLSPVLHVSLLLLVNVYLFIINRKSTQEL
ncbi:hypothetical protein [Radiobacillus deserti]|uniref:Uncharacterized protein n=1 Tax=Radiobacillus deserti TaxID=2594883 RepID=A0A516KIL4_9BACI|nr:hypothetical protein [Radiobacillus deserti]QDP41240.1 hypothetical protein FN924_14245 [Radiobacillus deserti]